MHELRLRHGVSMDLCTRLHQQLRKDLSLAEELQHFAGRAKSMTSAMRRRSLAALTAALPPRKHQLFQQGQAGQPASFLPTVEEATWRLLYASDLDNPIQPAMLRRSCQL